GTRDYQTTLKGNAFIGARALKPITRKKAEQILKGFLQRAEAVNADSELTYYVGKVYLFGSMLGNAVEVDDIDLAVEFELREVGGRDPIKHSVERAEASGKTFRSPIEMMFYGELEVKGILKARSPYISIHPLSDLQATGSQSRQIFDRKRK